jgi:hypothetical protein
MERKNIRRNANRPNANRTAFVQGRGHGTSREREEMETLRKLEEWRKLGDNETNNSPKTV